jgi:HSP20 family protein
MPNQIRNWDLMRDLIQMREALNRFYDENGESVAQTGRNRNGKNVYRLPIDAYSTDEAIMIEAPMAGADPEQVDITIDGDSLTIRAEVALTQSEDEQRNYLIRERGYGVLERSLTLNVPVELDKIEASFHNGVLFLTVPKAEAVKPRRITVKAAS